MNDPREDNGNLTLRIPRSLVSVVFALLVHGLIVALALLVPNPKPKPQRITMTVRQSPPKAGETPLPQPPPAERPTQKKSRAPPPTSPVVPELPPSQAPPENRAQLPVVEKAATPARPPVARTWEERLKESLAISAPKVPTGVLAPSSNVLARVADNDPRLHDDENERKLQTDHGPFFRRGIEALRGQWRPDEVLRSGGRSGERRDSTKLCGKQTRTTHAVAVINKRGNVVDVEMKNDSGCTPLDEEAVAAFLRVARFDFPPEDLFVNRDGTPADTFRFPVRFIVSFDGGLRLDWQ